MLISTTTIGTDVSKNGSGKCRWCDGPLGDEVICHHCESMRRESMAAKQHPILSGDYDSPDIGDLVISGNGMGIVIEIPGVFARVLWGDGLLMIHSRRDLEASAQVRGTLSARLRELGKLWPIVSDNRLDGKSSSKRRNK